MRPQPAISNYSNVDFDFLIGYHLIYLLQTDQQLHPKKSQGSSKGSQLSADDGLTHSTRVCPVLSKLLGQSQTNDKAATPSISVRLLPRQEDLSGLHRNKPKVKDTFFLTSRQAPTVSSLGVTRNNEHPQSLGHSVTLFHTVAVPQGSKISTILHLRPSRFALVYHTIGFHSITCVRL